MKYPILTADIGGTNARFGLAAPGADAGWGIERFAKFSGDDYARFEDVLADYLGPLSGPRPRNAIFSVAGPISDGEVQLTNRDWHLSSAHLCEVFGFERVELVNDFAAMTRSVPELSDDDFLAVKPGKADKNAPILVAGPGTGFGVGYLVPIKQSWHVLTTEGGHQAYSPQTDRELELLKILQKSHDFVSLELVSSGSGLPHVHAALCERHGRPYSPLSPAVIREKAHQGDQISLEICEIRAATVMGAIGDMALSGGARGGVVLAGGVSERMIEFFRTDAAMARFINRGPRSDYMADIPIRLLTHPHAALIGGAALLRDMS